MADRALQHRRLHNLLRIQKLFALREASSPFTLLLDSIEQSAKPLVRQYIRNAKISKIRVVFVWFETSRPSPDVDIIIKGRRKSADALQKEIATACATSQKTLLVIDTLIPLASLPSSTFNLPHFLSSLLLPHLSLVAAYHVDVPIPHSSTSIYTPSSLSLLKYLATTILTSHSFPQTLARKRAADKSLVEPLFGIAEEQDGVVVGMGANDPTALVVEMEHRRKSGRGVKEWFFVPLREDHATPTPKMSSGAKKPPPGGQESKIILLEDHPLWHPHRAAVTEPGAEDDGSTFELGLTAQQRMDRERVVLPYFDAQKADGGEGGRILYEMGIEDDFDEEEDEI